MTDMTTQEERIARLEQGFEDEQEWRREMLSEMRAGFNRLDTKIDADFARLDARIDRLESNQRWLVGLLLAILIAIIASNWIG